MPYSSLPYYCLTYIFHPDKKNNNPVSPLPYEIFYFPKSFQRFSRQKDPEKGELCSISSLFPRFEKLLALFFIKFNF